MLHKLGVSGNLEIVFIVMIVSYFICIEFKLMSFFKGHLFKKKYQLSPVSSMLP